MVVPLRFACVIPAYNREKTVGRAIESALAQTRTPDEVIVVDDGSTDGTREVVASYGASVRYVDQENSGASTARNRGVREATADWIAFLDSDDHFTPGHLEAMAAAIDATEGAADFYFANLRRTAEEGAHLQWEQARFSIEGPWELREDGTEWVVRPRIPMMLQGSVFQRSRFLAKGGLWEELRRRHDTHCFITHGVGHPICAVDHVGTVKTCDDTSGDRLTSVMAPRSEPYWRYSAMLWLDCLRRFPDLPRPQALLLRSRIVATYVNLARAHAAGHRFAAGLGCALRALRWSPGLVLRSVLGRRLSEEELYQRARSRR